MDICRADKAMLTQIKSMSTKPTGTASSEGAESLDLQALKARRSFQTSKQQKQCGNCGGRLLARQKCLATGSQCYKCVCQNHFARVCRSGTQPLQHKVHEFHEDQEASSEEELLIAAIENEAHRRIGVPLSPSMITLSPSKSTPVPSATSHLQPHQSTTTDEVPYQAIVAFGGHRLNTHGKVTLLCQCKQKFWPVEFEVLDNVPNVLGLMTSSEMRPVQRIEALANDVLAGS